VTDAVCSSSDEGHDTMLKLYRKRYSLQIEAVGSEAILQILGEAKPPFFTLTPPTRPPSRYMNRSVLLCDAK
jgi:hypothetical protein